MDLIQPDSLLPDIVGPELDVIFVGAAPSLQAASTGHYYAGGRNRFWRLLRQAGFTPTELDAEEDARVIAYRIGLTAILPNVISVVNSLLPGPTELEKERLGAVIAANTPRFVCYNGKDVWRMCTGGQDCRWGLQEDRLGESRLFVVHSSSGRADKWGADRLFLYRELKRLIDETAK